MSVEKLKNRGFTFLNLEKLSHTKRQIIVVGCARGGTSLVAGALHHLGIFGGIKSAAPVFEDVHLSTAFENKDEQDISDIISEYNERHDIWFWKRPSALKYLDEVDGHFTHPLYIFIFKDIFSIANRNSISMKSDIAEGLKGALEDYYRIVDFIQKTHQPVMLVSAEKALQNKLEFVDALAEVNADLLPLSNKEKAVEFITPNPAHYLDATRKTKSKGNLEYFSLQEAKGWAKRLYDDESVKVQLIVNENIVKTFVADQHRQDLIDLKISNTGKHGFNVDITDVEIEMHDNVHFIVEDDITTINHGDIIVKPNL
ncbi:hypothetical protein [Salinivibrio kushneri]|uniref:hypothetical protein n=1 Tax=Salinivibrio kushneri TaxID=1908198 RepID=UPI0022B4A5E0|nr:hypothetical protein [Salinivibrio kushneri]WBA17123.1 hypothetical protein O4598_08180 [Salinivibrio kushneri]